MFILWFEDLMEITGWWKCNFETQELQRMYWDSVVIPTYYRGKLNSWED